MIILPKMRYVLITLPGEGPFFEDIWALEISPVDLSIRRTIGFSKETQLGILRS